MTRYNPQWTQALSYSASVDRRLLSALWPGPGVLGCAVSPASAMTLNIAPGQVAVPTYNNSGSALCTSDAVEQVTLPAAPGSGLNRIDIVCCQLRVADVDASYTQNDFVFAVSSGAPAAYPTPPAVPNNAVVLAQVLVPGGSASVPAGNITDRRPPFGQQVGVPAGRLYATAQTIAASGAEQPIALAGTNLLFGGFTRQTIGQRDCLVIPVAGVYLVSCSVGWQSSMAQIPASQQIFTELWRNNAEVRRWFGATNWAAVPVVGGSDALQLNPGDVLDIRGFQSSGGPAGSWPDSGRTYLSAMLVSTGP